jgi:protein phosphatase
VHLHEADLAGGESILLCSDGLYGALDDAAIAAIVAGGQSPEDIVSHLVDESIARGVKDNVTAVLVRYEGS